MSFFVVGRWNSLMALVFASWGEIKPWPTSCPKNVHALLPNWALGGWMVSPAVLRMSKTTRMCLVWSSQSVLKIATSSMYTLVKLLQLPRRSSISRRNVAGVPETKRLYQEPELSKWMTTVVLSRFSMAIGTC